MVAVIWTWIVRWGTEQALMLHEFYFVFHAIMEVEMNSRWVQYNIYVCREMIIIIMTRSMVSTKINTRKCGYVSISICEYYESRSAWYKSLFTATHQVRDGHRFS